MHLQALSPGGTRGSGQRGQSAERGRRRGRATGGEAATHHAGGERSQPPRLGLLQQLYLAGGLTARGRQKGTLKTRGGPPPLQCLGLTINLTPVKTAPGEPGASPWGIGHVAKRLLPT